MTSWYLGLSTSGHDPALALVDPAGQVVFAESTERFLQDKRAWGAAPDHFAHLAAALATTAFDPAADRLVVATSWSTVKATQDVKLHDALLPATDTLWIRGLQAGVQQAAGASLLRLGLADRMPEIRRFDHHLCHAVTAAWFAPVEDAATLVIDGEGEVGAVSRFRMSGRRLERVWRSWGPGSLGTFYGWLTGLCGFDWRLGEEWKVMGLAAFGRPIPDLVEALAGMLRIDRGRPRFADDETIARIRVLAGRHARAPGDPVMQAADLAASGQAAYAGFADRIIAAVADDETGETDLILSGGCALNSSYNGTIAGRGGIRRLFVPPCPADDGNAIGAALLAWMADAGTDRVPLGDGSPFLGTSPDPRAIAAAAARSGTRVTPAGAGSAALVAERLAAGAVIGVMRGPAEFGPRALGHRSILADPRPQDMADRINREVKGREPYRPFAPVLPANRTDRWFERPQASPYMSLTLPWKPEMRERVPAVCHRDGTGRLQTVDAATAPWMSALIDRFEAITGVPVVLNTSFNVMGKPIVHSVQDAMAVLATTGLDGVLIGDLLLERPDQRGATS
jgi:carbamoyltransferase